MWLHIYVIHNYAIAHLTKPETRNQKPKPKLSMLEVVDFYKLKEKLNINKILLIVVS